MEKAQIENILIEMGYCIKNISIYTNVFDKVGDGYTDAILSVELCNGEYAHFVVFGNKIEEYKGSNKTNYVSDDGLPF